MSHEFEVRVDSAMMRTAWNAWCFRGQRIWPLLLASAVVLWIAYRDFRSGTLSVSTIFGLSSLSMLALIVGVTYWIGLRRCLSRLDAITDGRASYRLTDETIEARSSLGSVSLSWTAITELRRYRDLILIGFRGAAYSTIPASQIPESSLSFLTERCRAAGAKIIDL